MDSNVEYLGIHRFPGYAFGADGSVWSCIRIKGRSKILTRFGRAWKRLRIYQTSYGYSFVSMAGTTLQVARLILECFADARDRTFDPSHLNGDKTNCSISNLKWVPRAGGHRGFQPGHRDFVTEDGRIRIGEKTKARWAAGLMPEFSAETRSKISESGKGRKHTEEAKQKISQRSRQLASEGRLNLQNLTPEQRKKQVESRDYKGANHPGWKGGITHPVLRIRTSKRYAEWKRAIVKRDASTCQQCGSTNRRKLEVHHKKPFKVLFRELIELNGRWPTFEEVYSFAPLWDESNAVTLCRKCHRGVE